MGQIRTTLQNPTLRRLLASQVPADFADWLDFVAIGALLAFSWNAEPVAFAFLALSVGLPYVVIGPFAGAIVDRSDIRTLLIASNLGRALATASLILAATLPVLLLIVVLRSCVDAFYSPAKQAALQAIVTPENRMSANGISHAINQASKIAAPAIGGALLIIFEPGFIFGLNACVSLVAAGMLFSLPTIDRVTAETRDEGSLFASVRGGLSEITNNTSVRSALLVMAAGFFAMFFYDTLIAPLTRELGFDKTTFGIAISAVGLGGVFGALWLGLSKEKRRPFLWVSAGSLLSGVLITSLGISEIADRNISVAAFVGLFVIVGFSTAMVIVPIRTIIQRDTPPEKIARVTALSEAANTGAMLCAPFFGAAIASMISVGAAFVAGGVLLVAIAIYAMFVKRRSD